jgi:hypothetical protein
MSQFILPTTGPIYWAVEYSGAVAVTGQTQIGEATGAAYVVYANADENTFLTAVAGKAGNYNPLPDSGELLAGEIYGYGGGLVIVRQSHSRTKFAPEDTPALFSVYRPDATGPLAWVANEPVAVGTQRTYDGKTYRCIQAHTTQVDWTPPAVPALWAEVVVTPPVGAWAVGVAYKIGDEVTYAGLRYRCRQAHTSIASWTPPAVLSLWLPL